MTALLLLVCLWPRPELVPVGPADAAAALEIEQRSASARAGAVCPVCWDSPDRIPNRYVVGYRPGLEAAAQAALERIGAEIVRCDNAAGFIVCRSRFGRPDSLLNDTGVISYVEPDFRVQAARIPNDPYFLRYQWDKWVMYADKAWDVTTGNPTVKVAVIDNGADYQHPDLAARFVTGQYGYDFVGNDADPRPDNPSVSRAFHGTHVAGIIGAVTDNGTGVAGWAQIQLVAVRVLNDSGSGDLSDLATGIRWAVDHGCRVINMSLAATQSTTPLADACRYAAQADVLLFAAAGNDGANVISFPAALNECICIGATDEISSLASFSNYGPQQELLAPGTNVVSTGTGGGYVSASGTSMACPEVAGVGALLLSVDNSLSASRVRAVLAASAIDKGLSGWDDHYGYGLVNAARAVELAGMMSRSPAPAGSPQNALPAVCRGPLRLPRSAEDARVYDCQGRLVARLVGGEERALGSGTYFIVSQNPHEHRTARLQVVR